MTDPIDFKSIPGAAAAWDGYATASKSLQTFATELQTASKDSLEQSTQLMEKLRGATSMEEVVSIQTSFMRHSFASYADVTRRMSELMMAMPMELAKSGRAAFQQGTDAMTKASHEVGEQIEKAGDFSSQG